MNHTLNGTKCGSVVSNSLKIKSKTEFISTLIIWVVCAVVVCYFFWLLSSACEGFVISFIGKVPAICVWFYCHINICQKVECKTFAHWNENKGQKIKTSHMAMLSEFPDKFSVRYTCRTSTHKNTQHSHTHTYIHIQSRVEVGVLWCIRQIGAVVASFFISVCFVNFVSAQFSDGKTHRKQRYQMSINFKFTLCQNGRIEF